MHISKGHNSLKICSIDQIFFLQVQDIPIKIFCSLSLSLSKNHERKCQKRNFMAAILDFWRPSWIDNGYFLTLYSICYSDHLCQFWCFYHKVNEWRVFFLLFFCTNWLGYIRCKSVTHYEVFLPLNQHKYTLYTILSELISRVWHWLHRI